jgi:hypothetical protein
LGAPSSANAVFSKLYAHDVTRDVHKIRRKNVQYKNMDFISIHQLKQMTNKRLLKLTEIQEAKAPKFIVLPFTIV